MTILGKPTINKFRCKTEWIRCKICNKPFVRKKTKLRGSSQLPKNRTTCSKKCSTINLHQYEKIYAKEYRTKKRLEKKKLMLLKISAETNTPSREIISNEMM